MARILLVEDNKHQRLLLEEELQCEGYAVRSVGTGREAIEFAAAAKPDLVILDVGMPDMDGIELLGKLLGRHPRLPVVIYTGYEGYRDNFMTWAAAAYVLKKSDPSELLGAIRGILENSNGAEAALPATQAPWANRAAGQELSGVPPA